MATPFPGELPATTVGDRTLISGKGLLALFKAVNPNAFQVIVNCYDAASASAVTLGVTPPTATLLVDPNSTGGWCYPGVYIQRSFNFQSGVPFRLGIVVAATLVDGVSVANNVAVTPVVGSGVNL